jgi:hypothetical protein
MDPERVGLIIEEAGPRDDAIAGIMRSATRSWSVMSFSAAQFGVRAYRADRAITRDGERVCHVYD